MNMSVFPSVKSIVNLEKMFKLILPKKVTL